MRETILIIDPALKVTKKDHPLQRAYHYHTVVTYSVQEALNWMHTGQRPIPDTVLVDIPVESEQEIFSGLCEIKKINANLPIVALLQYGQEMRGMETIEAGCLDFLCKPVSLDRLRLTIQNALKLQRMNNYVQWLERKIVGHIDIKDMIGESPEFHTVLTQARQVSASSVPVWLEGEPGTGKSLLARAIHGSGDRIGKPFVSVNCELLPEHLASGILFGQGQAPVTAKVQFILGKIREADQGTLLLQEVGALQPELRAQIFDMMRSGVLTSIDGASSLPVNIRFIFSHSKNEKYENEHLMYRQQLSQYFQLCPIVVPPLSRRRSDIRLLAHHFLMIYATSENKFIARITDRAIEWLEQCQWPGNVGELANVIWRAVMLCEGNVIDISELKTVQKHRSVYLYSADSSAQLMDNHGKVKTLKSVEQEAIRYALQQSNGCMTRAARALGIGRSTLYRKVNELNIANQG